MSICNFCNSNDNSVIFEYTRFERNNILRCGNCGLIFLDIVIDDNNSINKHADNDRKAIAIEEYYKKQYRKDKTKILSPEEHFNDEVAKKDIIDRIQLIKNSVLNLGITSLRNIKVLEIGSASGGLMKRLQDEGTIVEGIELGDEYRKFSQKLGFQVYDIPIEKNKEIIPETYDLIVSFHTVEHFVDPKLAFRTIYNTLKYNGIFIGEVPNENDWRISIFDDLISKRFHYNPSHYYYFSPETLANYLIDAGFSGDKIKLQTVERYNSYIQLKRILCNKSMDYDKKNINRILAQQIFCEQSEDVRLHRGNNDEENFNRLFEKAVNSELLGNCLRFVAIK